MLTDHVAHGDGLAAFGLIKELAARGHELDVAAGGLEIRGSLPANVRLHRLGGPGRSLRLTRLRFVWDSARLYRRLASSSPFDVVHQLNPVDVGPSLALPRTAAPIVLGPYWADWASEGAGADLDAARGRLAVRAKNLLRAAQHRRAAAVLISTPAAAAKAGRSRVHELPAGIDDRAWIPAPADPRNQSVLFLANLERRKGIHVLLDAFARVSPELPGARLVVGGSGAEDAAVRRRATEPPLAGRVELLGGVPRDRVMAAMHACAVYCLPSYGEPFGISALEAMACARPVVGTRAGGLAYLVPPEGGRLVAPGDVEALAAALRELLAAPELRRSMGAHNRRVIEERFAWPRVVDRLEAVYGEALSAGARGITRGRSRARRRTS
jgi:glycosyltransferase involved in cell wall biosynthesis